MPLFQLATSSIQVKVNCARFIPNRTLTQRLINQAQIHTFLQRRLLQQSSVRLPPFFFLAKTSLFVHHRFPCLVISAYMFFFWDALCSSLLFLHHSSSVFHANQPTLHSFAPSDTNLPAQNDLELRALRAMSVYHSTTSGHQSSSSAPDATNGQSTADSTEKNNLTLDYLASVFASNGTIPPTFLPQHSAASNFTPTTGDIMNALIAAAAAAAAATATNNAVSPSTMDPFAASTLLCKLCCVAFGYLMLCLDLS